MNYLITGGIGLIGTALYKKLKKDGNKIYLIDNKNVKSSHKKFNYKRIDITKEKLKLKKYINDKKINILIHLAAFLGVEDTENQPKKVINVNFSGTKNVLDACDKSKVKKFVFSSSSEVYGDQNKKFEETLYPRPKSLYGFYKWQAERLVKDYCSKKKINFQIVRFFNVYGPRQKMAFVVPKFIGLALKNKNIFVYGDGSQIRSFCFIDDAIKGLDNVIKFGKKNTIYNIGNDKEPINVMNLAKKIIKITNSSSKIKKIPFYLSDRKKNREIFKRIPNIKKIKSHTRYNPQINLSEGIKKILKS